MSSVSHKHKHGVGPGTSTADLEPRIRKALKENRTQQALELAKQLFKYEPTAAHKDLLRIVYRERARQLREQGNTRDAGTVLENLVPLCDDATADTLAQLAQDLAQCGSLRRALEIQAQLADPALQSRVLGHIADAAVAQGGDAGNLLGAELQAGFDLVLRAFEHAEARQDDAARETLQGIGLQSPFLEWKVMLRGLLAYYQNDNARAVENWQRLTADRLCARLVAPLRFTIDSAYRVQQPPETQRSLQRQADRFQGPSLIQSLRVVQAALANRHRLTEALRLAGGMLPALREQAAALVPRLASCFYWAIVQGGDAEDVPRFRRVFGAPADDPNLSRLQALLCEHGDELEQAYEHWQQFEQGVAANPAPWAGGTDDPARAAHHVRALVWEHMGQLAAATSESEGDEDEDDDGYRRYEVLGAQHAGEPDAPLPDAAECFRKSIELAPERLPSYQGLLTHYLQQEDTVQAADVAGSLLQRFPDHVPTLETLGRLRIQQERYAEAIELFEKALRGNPLDRRLRAASGIARTHLARHLADKGRFAEARAEYQAVLADDSGGERTSTLCKWAACEFKSGDSARGEELLQQALAAADNHLAVAFSMLVEAIRFKLPKLKSRFDKEFAAGLAAPPTAGAAVAVVETAASHHVAEVNYRGQKTHTKKVIDYLVKACTALTYTEDQLERLCVSLSDLEAATVLRSFAQLGKQWFRKNPFFPFHEAESYFIQGPRFGSVHRLMRPLEQARKLAQDLPPGDKKQFLLDRIEIIAESVNRAGPLGGMMRQMMAMFAGLDEDDQDDEDFEDFDGFDDLPFPLPRPGQEGKKRRKPR